MLGWERPQDSMKIGFLQEHNLLFECSFSGFPSMFKLLANLSPFGKDGATFS
jgi:hypothetical protein